MEDILLVCMMEVFGLLPQGQIFSFLGLGLDQPLVLSRFLVIVLWECWPLCAGILPCSPIPLWLCGISIWLSVFQKLPFETVTLVSNFTHVVGFRVARRLSELVALSWKEHFLHRKSCDEFQGFLIAKGSFCLSPQSEHCFPIPLSGSSYQKQMVWMMLKLWLEQLVYPSSTAAKSKTNSLFVILDGPLKDPETNKTDINPKVLTLFIAVRVPI